MFLPVLLQPCPICMNNLSEPSGFGDDSPLSNTQPPPPLNVYKLRKCAHRLHYHCLVMYLKNSAKVISIQYLIIYCIYIYIAINVDREISSQKLELPHQVIFFKQKQHICMHEVKSKMITDTLCLGHFFFKSKVIRSNVFVDAGGLSYNWIIHVK